MAQTKEKERSYWGSKYTYDVWMESIGIPIHKGYYIEDLRTLELGWWEERQCSAAFIQLMGQEGISSARVTEIPPGTTLPPLKFALDEIVYVVDGLGLATIWAGDGMPKKIFEWQKFSMFMLPRNHWHQLSNVQENKTVRLLHYSYMPLILSGIRDAAFLFNNPYQAEDFVNDPDADFYSAAEMVEQDTQNVFYGKRAIWYGNFFPDMRAWDRLDANASRGAGGRSVFIQFPNSEVSCHMSVFDARTYKKAHRHGPGRVIVIPAGEGYSVMWEEGKDKIVIPWHEASVLVPPNRWFHQHFNAGAAPARYLALHPPFQFYGYGEKVEDASKDQIEYPDEDPWIRKKFEGELAKGNLKSLMPDEAYRDRKFTW